MSTRTYSARIAAVALCAIAACSKNDPPRQPTVPVSVTTVKRASVPYVVTANGVAEPMQTVAVESQVNGILNRVTFAEGQPVQAGQVLFEIDSRPYVAVLDQARAQLARDQAMAVSAQRDAVRYAALVKEGYVTGSQADQAEANAASAAATVAADRANVQKAALDVANTTIRAPISGRTGSLLVRQGNLVKANSTPPLVVINQIQPILVRFAIAQSQFPDIQRYYRGGNALLVRATPSEGSGVPLMGTLAFVDNNVDSTTGNRSPQGAVQQSRRHDVARAIHERRVAVVRRSQCVDAAGSSRVDRTAGHVCVHDRHGGHRQAAAGSGLAHRRFPRRHHEWRHGRRARDR